MAEKILMNEFKQLAKETWTNISLINENIYEWSVALIRWLLQMPHGLPTQLPLLAARLPL
jgi:hypothetical protein